MSRDYNPRRYRTRIGERDERTTTERQLDKAIAERDKARAELDDLRDTLAVMDRAITSTTRTLDVTIDQQHRYRIAFMLFAQDVNAAHDWQTTFVHYLQRADKHIGGR